MIMNVTYETRGNHTFARVFMGDDQNALTICGNLMFKEPEFKVYRKLLEDGVLLSKDVKVMFLDAAGGSSSVIPKVKG
jgi:hypothetical protein